HSFYDLVHQRYEGITRNDVEKFLKGQPSYQIHKKTPKKLMQPQIRAQKPFDLLQVDYIDLGGYEYENGGYRYCLTMIDVFSRYAFAFPCKSRDAESEQKKAFEWLFSNGLIWKTVHGDQEF